MFCTDSVFDSLNYVAKTCVADISEDCTACNCRV